MNQANGHDSIREITPLYILMLLVLWETEHFNHVRFSQIKLKLSKRITILLLFFYDFKFAYIPQ